MLAKQNFYAKYGVLEMLFYDPDSHDFWGLVRSGANQDFSPVTPILFPWVSPLLGVRFELFAEGLGVFYPQGEPFKGEPFKDLGAFIAERDRVQEERDRAFAKLREWGIDPEQLI